MVLSVRCTNAPTSVRAVLVCHGGCSGVIAMEESRHARALGLESRDSTHNASRVTSIKHSKLRLALQPSLINCEFRCNSFGMRSCAALIPHIRSNWLAKCLIRTEQSFATLGRFGNTSRRVLMHCISLCNLSTVVVEAPSARCHAVEHVKEASHVDDVGTRIACRRRPRYIMFRLRSRSFQYLLI